VLNTTPPGHVSLTARRLSQQTLADRAFRPARHHLIALARPSPRQTFWHYDDAGMLALLTADPQAAGRFVQVQLAGLLGTNQKLTDFRETLRHFLLAGSSRIAAAQALHLASTLWHSGSNTPRNSSAGPPTKTR
jgi:DNA-binding PucR family transcriptional regulator